MWSPRANGAGRKHALALLRVLGASGFLLSFSMWSAILIGRSEWSVPPAREHWVITSPRQDLRGGLMNVNPSTNMVVFDIEGHGEPMVTSGATQDDYCVQRAWLSLPVKHSRAARKVARIYSEWQPSEADTDFIKRTFPKAALTYSFERPGPGGWDAAFAAARGEIERAAGGQEAQRATDNMRHVAEQGELLPVLWSRSSPKMEMLQLLPHLDLVPGQLHFAAAAVAMTPQGRIGMNHVTSAQLGDQSFSDVMTAARGNLTSGLRVDGHTDPSHPDKGHLLVVRREGPFASSAVTLPDFHQQMAAALKDDHLLVGLPDPETVLVTRTDSGWVDDVRQAVLASPCPSSELVPTLLAYDPTAPGPRLVAERPEPAG